MTLQELKKLVRQGEGLKVEFKRKTIYPYKIVKEVVAMANAQGGVLLIGIDDNGTIAGLQNAKEDEFVLRKAIDTFCSPAVSYKTEQIKINTNLSVLAFHIAESTQKPIYRLYDLQKNIGKAYFRVADKSLQASREIRKILQYQDDNPYKGFSYGENERKLMKYLEKYNRIDVLSFAKLTELKVFEASELLVRLTLCQLLKIVPQEDKDYFMMKE